MSGLAIVMMIVAMLVIWGGLALAIVNLNRHPEATEPAHDDVRRDL